MNKKQIIFGIALVIIVIGIVMQYMLGFNISFNNGTYTSVRWTNTRITK